MHRVPSFRTRDAGAAILCLTGSALGAASFQGLGDLTGGSFDSGAYAIGTDGSTVVGYGNTEAGVEAMRWTVGTGMVGMGDFAGGDFYSYAQGVSADGSVIVGLGTGSSGARAFRWTLATGMIDMSVLSGHAESGATCVSDDGLVIGGYSATGFPTYTVHAFRWTLEDGMVNLGTLLGDTESVVNGISMDGTTLVGSSRAGDGTSEAIRWTSGTGMVGLGQLRGAAAVSGAYDANTDGSVIVGEDPNAAFEVEAFRWTIGEGMTGLGGLPGSGFVYTTALSVSADGSVLVGYAYTESGFQAMIWTEADGVRSLKDVLEDDHGLDLTGWSLDVAYGISGDGTRIAGAGTNPSGFNEAFLAVIPGPALCAGDVNGNGSTNIADFNILAGNFGESVTPGTGGDLTGDGLVNISDFNILAGDFGCTTS